MQRNGISLEDIREAASPEICSKLISQYGWVFFLNDLPAPIIDLTYSSNTSRIMALLRIPRVSLEYELTVLVGFDPSTQLLEITEVPDGYFAKNDATGRVVQNWINTVDQAQQWIYTQCVSISKLAEEHRYVCGRGGFMTYRTDVRGTSMLVFQGSIEE